MDHEGVELIRGEAAVRAELERKGDGLAAGRRGAEEDDVAGGVHLEQVARIDGGERVADEVRKLERIGRLVELESEVAPQRHRSALGAHEGDADGGRMRAALEQARMA